MLFNEESEVFRDRVSAPVLHLKRWMALEICIWKEEATFQTLAESANLICKRHHVTLCTAVAKSVGSGKFCVLQSSFTVAMFPLKVVNLTHAQNWNIAFNIFEKGTISIQ